MKKLWTKLNFVCLLILWTSSIALADIVELENGSKIIGTIQKIDQKAVVVKTDFAGVLTIDIGRVLSLSTDHPVFVSFPSQSRIFGKITYDRVQTQVVAPDGTIYTSREAPVNAWPEGAPDFQGRHWHYELGLDVAGKTGNVERVSTGGRAQAKLPGPDDLLLLYLRYAYAKDDGIESDNILVGGIDFESYFSGKQHSWYARVELENDRIKNIDLRATAATGYGYFFLKKPNHTLRGRTGLMYRHESLKDEPSDGTVGMDVGLSHMYQFTNAWKIINDIIYAPSIEDYRNYRIYHESIFEIPIVVSNLWKLQLGLSNDYSSRPADGMDYLDTTYFGRIVFSWK